MYSWLSILFNGYNLFLYVFHCSSCPGWPNTENYHMARICTKYVKTFPIQQYQITLFPSKVYMQRNVIYNHKKLKAISGYNVRGIHRDLHIIKYNGLSESPKIINVIVLFMCYSLHQKMLIVILMEAR